MVALEQSAVGAAPNLDPRSLLDVLRALGEPTRLRIVAVLRAGELSVSDLVSILGQSQPRVSRHLKLLGEAGVVSRHREGAWAFFSLVDDEPLTTLVDTVVSLADPDDPTLARDRERLAAARARRSADAAAYFERIAPIWDEERSLHASQEVVDAAVDRAAGDGRLGRVLDLGTGTGRMIQLLARRADRIVGLDTSHSMLAVARSNLDSLDGVDTVLELRQGDIYHPPFEPGSFDVVVMHQVLHYLDDPALAIAEAARLVAPAGRLVIVDFAPHRLEQLREAHAHRRLGFDDEHIAAWAERADMMLAAADHLAPPTDTDGLTVTVWTITPTT